MLHGTPLISTIVAGLVLAFIFGTIANRLRLPPLVGYLFAGILVGPYTPGFLADQSLAPQLAEIGVILLMFGVGLHFSLKDLMSVRALAIPGALGQIAFATLLGLGLGLLMGWSVPEGLMFGLALSVASTVVLLKALQDRRLIDTERGRLAIGWLIVEDLAMVLTLVLIPAFMSASGADAGGVHDPFVAFVERILGTSVGLAGVIVLTLVKIAAFVGFMLVVGRRVIPWGLHAVAHTGNRELFRLAVLAIALGVAAGSAYLFGVSLALGAFFAGMILSESELSHRAAQETLPLRDAFAVLFFVSVGMLFDPGVLLRDPFPVLATLAIILIGKAVIASGIMLAFRQPVSTALVISASLAQIGEFSFILAALGVRLGLLRLEGQDLILAGAILSILLNPLMFWALDRARPLLEARLHRVPRREPAEPSLGPVLGADAEPVPVPKPEEDDLVVHPTALTGHLVLIGYGRVGRVVAEGLQRAGEPFLVIEDADARIALARAAGLEVVVGNAASGEVLDLANIAGARSMLIAIPNAFEAGQAAEQSRKLNPAIRIVARAHSDDEEHHLTHLGADTVILGEREIGLGMLSWLQGEEARAAALPAEEPVAATPAPEVRLAPAENLISRALPHEDRRPREEEPAPPPEPTAESEARGEQLLADGPITSPTIEETTDEAFDPFAPSIREPEVEPEPRPLSAQAREELEEPEDARREHIAAAPPPAPEDDLSTAPQFEPADPEPADSEPTDLAPTDVETTDVETADLEPADLEPADIERTDVEPAEPHKAGTLEQGASPIPTETPEPFLPGTSAVPIEEDALSLPSDLEPSTEPDTLPQAQIDTEDVIAPDDAEPAHADPQEAEPKEANPGDTEPLPAEPDDETSPGAGAVPFVVPEPRN